MAKRLILRLVVEEIVPDEKIRFIPNECEILLRAIADKVHRGEKEGRGWFITQHERKL